MIYSFDSTMPNALPLSGSAGSLRAILKAYLVDGAGTSAVSSLTVSGGVATAAYGTTHSFRVGSIAQYTGATPAGLNGLKPIIAATTLTVSFAAPGIPDGVATGSISSKLAPAGWAELFGGTANFLALKSADPASTGMVLRVDDTGTTNARIRAYESMSDINTGSGPVPLDLQLNGGLYWPKSGEVSAAARPWIMVADSRSILLAVSPQGTDRYTLLCAGDIASYKSADAWSFLLTGNQADQTNASVVPDGCCGYSGRSARNGAYLARLHTAVGQSAQTQRVGAHHTGTSAEVYAGLPGYAWGTYPNGPNNGLLVSPLELFASGVRGTIPGLLHPVQDCGQAFATGTVLDGTDDYVGRKLMAIRVAPPSGGMAAGTVFLDVTGPWGRG
ncbi:hypothetical protein [Comamonas sp.]|uniref:hypothetical protein n=1 Tax=Comamonas sp. TaxID=34028 RepID=UPI0028AAAD36|nr:hypothetical protein [Comamonas sp.]